MAARAPEEPGFLPPERKDLPKNRPGESIRVGQKLNAIFAGMPPKVADRMKVASIYHRFAEAIIEEYRTLPAAIYVLERIQGVYLEKDDTPRKAGATGEPLTFLKIYTTDATLKADLDYRQESIRRRLRAKGIIYDRMKKPYSSRGDMRYRTPFADVVAELKAKLAAQEGRAGAGEGGEGTAAHWTEERVDELLADVQNAELAARIRAIMLSE